MGINYPDGLLKAEAGGSRKNQYSRKILKKNDFIETLLQKAANGGNTVGQQSGALIHPFGPNARKTEHNTVNLSRFGASKRACFGDSRDSCGHQTDRPGARIQALNNRTAGAGPANHVRLGCQKRERLPFCPSWPPVSRSLPDAGTRPTLCRLRCRGRS
jgi:hypothetical protein